MLYSLPLIQGKFIRRYLRFLADVMVDGEVMTVHCPNTGSMAGLLDEGNPVRISGPHSGKRKHPFTLEQIRISRPDGRKIWVGVNTAVPEIIAAEAAGDGKMPGLKEYRRIKRQVAAEPGTRIDFLLEAEGRPPCWVEVKSVTLVLSDHRAKDSFNCGRIAAFPDAVTVRGAKHLRFLSERALAYERALMLYIVQRSDGELFAPASGFDPRYAEELISAEEAGVEVLAMQVRVTEKGIWLSKRLDRLEI